MSWSAAKPTDQDIRDPSRIVDLLREVYTRGRTFGSFTWNPPNVPANSTVDTTLTTSDDEVFTGLRVGQAVYVTPPSTLDSGLVVGAAWVATDDTLTIRLANVTGVGINAAEGTYSFDGRIV